MIFVKIYFILCIIVILLQIVLIKMYDKHLKIGYLPFILGMALISPISIFFCIQILWQPIKKRINNWWHRVKEKNLF